MPETSNSWLDFLVSQGASLSETAPPEVASAPDSSTGAGTTLAHNDFFTAATHLGTLALEGADAANFLHNQITNDVLSLENNTARLAGYCSPKGRLLATLLLWKSEDQLFLTLPRDILPGIQKRLQMFVMRAKVKITDVSDSRIALGLYAPSIETLQRLCPTLPATAYEVAHGEAGTLIRLADALHHPRYYLIGTLQQACDAWQMLSQFMPAAPTSLWRWTEIMAGVPQITQATQEQFVPQMINFEAIGGVNFRKGCYPGQEIVARSQYLGKFKRRMFVANLESTNDVTDVQAGTEVFSSQDPEQPCGMVVNADRGPDGRLACLVELKLDAIVTTIHAAMPDGPVLQLGSLPYVLPEPE